jgi:hypothetical protein
MKVRTNETEFLLRRTLADTKTKRMLDAETKGTLIF